jgi:hypothetical protein
MTIRQVMLWWYRSLTVVVVASAVLAFLFAAQNHVIQALVCCVFALFANVLFVWRFRCPRCSTSLFKNIVTILSRRPGSCPKCGVSLDEPMKSPANRK